MTNAIAPVGTSGLTLLGVLWNRAGQIWDFTNSVWKSFSSGAGTDTISATEYGTSGVYGFAVPSAAQKEWLFATFHETNKNGVALATCDNTSITNASIPSGTMLRRTVARFGGQTPTRNATTGTKTFKDEDGNIEMTETPTSEQSIRVFSEG